MIRMKFTLSVCLCLAITISAVNAQESAVIIHADYYFPDAHERFDDDLFGIALAQFENQEINDNAIKGLAQTSFELDETRAVNLILESISRSNDQREINNLYVSVADRYFNQLRIKDARKYYLLVDRSILADEQQEELLFRLGYSYIVEKNFGEAEKYLSHASKFKGRLYADSQYYLGISQYFLGREEDAIASFESVDNVRRYQGLVPYYLTQMYFKGENYDKVISYTEPRLNQGISNRTQILKILGLSYLAVGNNDKALFYLDAYATESPRLTENEFYQIGSLHYQLNKYDKAIQFFSELSHQDSEIGQVSNYLAASIYLRGEDKKKAQSAYKQASKYDYYPDIREESNFLYYKLSADLNEERIAISGLSKIKPESKYYDEAQVLLAENLIRSQDFKGSLTAIENMENKSAPILDSYKNISYDYGVQQLAEGNAEEAKKYLEISQNTPGSNSELNRKADFYLGYAYDQSKEKAKSRSHLQDYIKSGDTDHLFDAHYLLAFQDVESKNYSDAKIHFEEALQNFNEEHSGKALVDDAIIRLADLELLDNNYQKAIEYYDLAIDNGADESDYILYQKALIYGVNNQHLEKLSVLKELFTQHQQSKYRDDALFEIGESLVALNKNNDAVKAYQSLLAEYKDSSPYSALSYLRLGLISYNQGDLKSAIEYYKKGINLGIDKDEERQAMLAIEEIYVRDLNDPQSYFEFAEEQGKQIEDISRDSISYTVGWNAYKDGKYYEAIQLLNNYLDNYTSGYYKEDAHYHIAESAVLLKDYDIALEQYEEIIKNKWPKYYTASIEKAALIAFNHFQNFRKSYDLYELLIDLEPRQPLNIYESALFSAYKIQNEEGIIQYATYISADTNAANDKKAVAHFYMGKSYQRRDMIDEAISNYNKVVNLSSGNQAAESAYRVASLLFKRGQTEAAETQAFETTKIAAKYPFWVAKSLILLGDIYTQIEDFLNASAAYESVIENFSDSEEIIAEAEKKLEDLEVLISSNNRVKPEEKFELIQNDSIK